MSLPVNILSLCDFKDVLLTKSECEAASRFTLKKVKENQDRNGAPVFSFSIYLDNKLLADEVCELYGEEPKHYFARNGEKRLQDFIDGNSSLIAKVAEASNCESDCTHSVFRSLIIISLFAFGHNKTMKKTKKNLIIGNYEEAKMTGWGSYTLAEVFALDHGDVSIKNTFQKMLDEAKPGYFFYNTKEQLESLGLGEFIGKHPAVPA